eukprot:gb/GECG01009126.1/.p1 GENE.gb/GECG01009126.1/~~gb/GECG01009126.1/.p1  ORF type:complete len:1118 (+),score=207.89 gb/GECG01009126.1/:1-3354(+)
MEETRTPPNRNAASASERSTVDNEAYSNDEEDASPMNMQRDTLLKEARQRNVSWVLSNACFPAPIVSEKSVQHAVYERLPEDRIVQESGFHPDILKSYTKKEKKQEQAQLASSSSAATPNSTGEPQSIAETIGDGEMETSIVKTYTAIAKKSTSKLRALRAIAETSDDLRSRGTEILQALKDTSELADTLRALAQDDQDAMSDSRASSSYMSAQQEAYGTNEEMNSLTAPTLPPWRRNNDSRLPLGDDKIKRLLQSCEEVLHTTGEAGNRSNKDSNEGESTENVNVSRLDELLDRQTMDLVTEIGMSREELEQYDNFVLKLLRPEASDIIEMIQGFVKRVANRAPLFDLGAISSDAEFLWGDEEDEEDDGQTEAQFSDNASADEGTASASNNHEGGNENYDGENGSESDHDTAEDKHNPPSGAGSACSVTSAGEYALSTEMATSPKQASRRASEFASQPMNDIVYSFLRKVKEAMKENPLWRNEPSLGQQDYKRSHQRWESSLNGLQRFVFGLLYPSFSKVTPQLSKRDKVLYNAFTSKHNCGFSHLEVTPPPSSLDNAWKAAQLWIGKMQTYKAPNDKIQCLLNACATISAALEMKMSGTAEELDQQDPGQPVEERKTPKVASVGADDMLPVLIYCVIHACPSRFYTCVHYIGAFKDPSQEHSEEGYFYTNLLSAISFAKDTPREQLKLSDEDESQNHGTEATTKDHSSTHKKVMENLEQWHQMSVSEPSNLRIPDEELESNQTKQQRQHQQFDDISSLLDACRSLSSADFDADLKSLQDDTHKELVSTLRDIAEDAQHITSFTDAYSSALHSALQQSLDRSNTRVPGNPVDSSTLFSCIETLNSTNDDVYEDGGRQHSLQDISHFSKNHEATWSKLWNSFMERNQRMYNQNEQQAPLISGGANRNICDKISSVEDECETDAFEDWLEKRLEPLYNMRAVGRVDDENEGDDEDEGSVEHAVEQMNSSTMADMDRFQVKHLCEALCNVVDAQEYDHPTLDGSVFQCAPPQPLTMEVVDSIATALQHLHNDILPALSFDPYKMAVLFQEVSEDEQPQFQSQKLVERRKAVRLLDDLTFNSLPILLSEYRQLATVVQRLISMSIEEFIDEEDGTTTERE